MKSILTLIFVFFLFVVSSPVFFGCSSVQKIENFSSVLQEPTYKALSEDEIVQGNNSSSDYKIRKNGNNEPIFVLAPVQIPAGMDPKLSAFLNDEIRLIWAKVKGKQVRIADAVWKNPSQLSAEFKKSEVDAVVRTSIREAEGKWLVTQKIEDPVKEIVYGKLDASFQPPSSQNELQANQVYYLKHSSGVLALDPKNSLVPIWEKSLSSGEIDSILKKSIQGYLSFSASSADTEVVFQGEKIGISYFRNYPLPEGSQQIQITRPGQKDVLKTIQIRAGQTVSLYQEWKEDRTLGGIRILSFPEALQVALDGFRNGETPFYRSNLPAGALQLELLKDTEKGPLVYYEGQLVVQSDKITEIALPYKAENLVVEPEFWKLSGEKGFQAFAGKTLDFQNVSNLPPGWFGVFSVPFVAENLEISGVIPISSESDGGIVAFSLHTPKKTVSLEYEKERLSVYTFPSDGKDLGSYRFKKEEKEEGRPFRIVTDLKEGTIRLYLGYSKVLEDKLDPASGAWRISVVTRGEKFSKRSPIRNLKIEYKGYK
ncbi:PEGA domain-containing protein [Leptospira gomenensis]|uniref:PEGA domain-containing protein n=1 Tax=Leptospira gomenensis TaxID=2484974 RepID=A0A5F1Y602_9LEPT|nr:PEGA domain-containing protein [Leptospira gomenensis]TGK28113.1 PEGA domain-containing protein [Leptospira gomenensis]TGK37031.1 PEGA domain-containing protein [Leptospira gomenensis]TGK45667.1 PEGA domain-containing protein [Leptospira gomenensis]TGK59606.1 PEGA domain-containing protein [Leptospira gomenensis]